MDPRIGRTPSPGHPINHGYQLEDAPAYGRQYSGSPGPGLHGGNLDIPMGPGPTGRMTPSDRMLPQPTVCACRILTTDHIIDENYSTQSKTSTTPLDTTKVLSKITPFSRVITIVTNTPSTHKPTTTLTTSHHINLQLTRNTL